MKLRLGEEMTKKYVNTYIRIKMAVHEPWQVYYIDCFSHPEAAEWPSIKYATQVQGYVIDIENGSRNRVIVDLAGCIIDLSIPKLGLVNDMTLKAAVFMCKTPKKQWKRGVSSGNINAFNLTGEYTSDYFASPLMDHLRGLSARHPLPPIWYPNHVPFNAAVEHVIKGDMLTMAFNYTYAVGINRYFPDRLGIYYKTMLIGLVDQDRATGEFFIRLPKKAEHFVEDLSQYVKVEVGP